jgi:hypothetical protein
MAETPPPRIFFLAAPLILSINNNWSHWYGTNRPSTAQYVVPITPHSDGNKLGSLFYLDDPRHRPPNRGCLRVYFEIEN